MDGCYQMEETLILGATAVLFRSVNSSRKLDREVKLVVIPKSRSAVKHEYFVLFSLLLRYSEQVMIRDNFRFSAFVVMIQRQEADISRTCT